jgi:cation transport ATPase
MASVLHRARALAVRRSALLLLIVTAAGLAGGGIAALAGAGAAGDALWLAAAAAGLGYALWVTAVSIRHGRVGVDLIAVLALAGAMAVGELLAAAVIAVMLASGRALEQWAAQRAQRDLHALLARAPRTARRYRGGSLETVPLAGIAVGDLLMVAPGDVVPVDGTIAGGAAVLDESALTGEALPVGRAAGDTVRSGVLNAGGPFDLRAVTSAEDSTYAGIIRLVAEAEKSQAPFVRLADRYALWFLPLTLAVAGAAWKHGGVLERLAQCRTLLLDKTGTLTAGQPTVTAIIPAGWLPPAEVLRAAASLDQVSAHVLAGAILRAAAERKYPLTRPEAVTEEAGRGITGTVAGRPVSVGRADWAGVTGTPPWVKAVRRRARLDGVLTVFVAVDHRPAGALLLEDRIRPDARATIRAVRRGGIDRIVLATGDRAEVAEAVGAITGVDEVRAGLTPAEKLEVVRDEQRRGPVIMTGDGINDAPALALADVGIAMGARGSTASSEAADAVLTVDRLSRLGEVAALARRTRAIARQSVVAGMGLSLAAMGVAAAGLLPAVWGALLQEAIDVAVILNALRALRPATAPARLAPADAALTKRFRDEHEMIHAATDQIRAAADALATAPPAAAMSRVRRAYTVLTSEIGPHENAEDTELYPVVSRLVGGDDPTAPMSRAHAEIGYQITRLGRLLDDIGDQEPDQADVADLRSLLYGLDAILRLHTAQEDETYLSLGDPAGELTS